VRAKPGWPPLGDFDPPTVATVCALVTGVLSCVDPFLVALTGALVALSFAGWCALVGRAPRRVRAVLRPDRGFALGVLGLAVVLCLAPPLAVAPYRGVLLGAAAVPLWWTGRHRPAGVSPLGAPG